MNPALHGLYAVTPDDNDTRALVAKVREAILGGAAFVQYRNKSAPASQRLEQAAALRELCHAHGARLIVNDDPRIALEAGADGVHLGRDDGPVAAARAILGPNRIVGVSCYNQFENALDAAHGGADYVAFGSFFPSAVKPGAVRAPLELLARARRELTIPVVAIGGITPENASGVIAAGAHSVAVISALFDSPDVRAVAERFRALFGICR